MTNIKSQDLNFFEIDFLSRGDIYREHTFYNMEEPITATKPLERQKISFDFSEVNWRDLLSNEITNQEPEQPQIRKSLSENIHYH